jgi:hypothetical protein
VQALGASTLMTTTTEPGSAIARVVPGTSGEAETADDSRAFVRWGVAVYLATVAVMVLAIVVYLGGHLVYVLDDPAIHLSVADQLVHHGTWGVTAGRFESASSSPLWTLLVAPGTLVTPVRDWWPLVLNVLAGIGAIIVLGRNQTVLRPHGRDGRLDAVATAVLVVVVLFLPGLAVVGMEHTLHVALVLAAVALVHRRAEGHADRFPTWAPLAIVALASLTRFETAFVALGLAAALIVGDRSGGRRPAVELLAAAAAPIVAFGVVNRLMGGGWLPNSILAKGQGTGNSGGRDGLGPVDIFHRLTQDPVVAALFAVAVAYLVMTWGRTDRRAPSRLPAITFVVATACHAVLADVGWYARYQAYLIAVGVYALLGMLAELPPDLRRRALVACTALAAVFSLTKVDLGVDAYRAADDMYRHQYQAARFLDRYYDHASIATDQLGYISLLHDGPLTDLAGLGDYEVLQADRSRALWEDLTERRGLRVAVVYDISALPLVPDSWVLAGQLRIDGRPTTTVSRRLQIYATTIDEVDPLQERLAEFEADLPPRVHLELNEYADLQVMGLQAEEDAAGP